MRFLVDRCTGSTLAEWLRNDGHDVLATRSLGVDPGDQARWELVASSNRMIVTIDTDFGELIYLHNVPHAGLIRLPDMPAEPRLDLVAEIISRHSLEVENRAIVTVRGERIRVSHPPTN